MKQTENTLLFKSFLLGLLFLFSCLRTPAQKQAIQKNGTLTDSLSITGSVRDKEDKSLIYFFSVDLKKGDSVVASDVTNKDGTYHIYNLETGNYTLVGISDGYKAVKLPVKVTKGKTLKLDLLASCDSCKTTALFSKYNFEDGGYSLLGVREESEPNTLADSLGYFFFTDNIALLNAIKKSWVFRKPSPRYACGYHYFVSLCKNGKRLESFAINISCHELAGNSGYFYFEENKLRQFYRKFKEPFTTSKDFITVPEARAFYRELVKDTLLILADAGKWLTYEGEFQFTSAYSSAPGDSYMQSENHLRLLNQEFRKTFPGEDFELEDWGGSSSEMTVKVSCNYTLFYKYHILHPLDSEKWVPYPLNMTCYWKKKHY